MSTQQLINTSTEEINTSLINLESKIFSKVILDKLNNNAFEDIYEDVKKHYNNGSINELESIIEKMYLYLKFRLFLKKRFIDDGEEELLKVLLENKISKFIVNVAKILGVLIDEKYGNNKNNELLEELQKKYMKLNKFFIKTITVTEFYQCLREIDGDDTSTPDIFMWKEYVREHLNLKYRIQCLEDDGEVTFSPKVFKFELTVETIVSIKSFFDNFTDKFTTSEMTIIMDKLNSLHA